MKPLWASFYRSDCGDPSLRLYDSYEKAMADAVETIKETEVEAAMERRSMFELKSTLRNEGRVYLGDDEAVEIRVFECEYYP